MFSTLMQLLKAAVYVFAVMLVSTSALASQAVVLVYHRFGEDDVPSTNIRLEQFEAQLDWLISEGAHFPSLDRLYEERDGFSVIFTVDDAYASAALEAWPSLKKRGIPMALFVASEPVDQGLPRYMSWDDIRRLRDEGVTIGFHGHAHHHMAFLNPEDARRDLDHGLKRFQEELGSRPDYFAYPYGEYDTRLKDMVKAMGFKAAFAQYSGVAGRYSDPYALPRFAINERYGEEARFQLVAKARAMPVISTQPGNPLVAVNPPKVVLHFEEGAQGWRGISCFPSHTQGSAPLKIAGNRVEVDLVEPLPKGRSRLNCTYKVNEAWYWFGMPFLVPGGALD